MSEDYRGRTYIGNMCISTVLLCFSSWGWRFIITIQVSLLEGVLYGRYGGSTTVSYGGNGFFIIAAALLVRHLLIWLFTPNNNNRKNDNFKT